VQIYVFDESVHDVQCVAATQLHQEPSVIIYVNAILANPTLPSRCSNEAAAALKM